MAATVNVNGRIFDQEHAVISVFDHGFLYGEGVYETLRTYNGRSFLFDRHMRRLRNSANMMALGIPLSDAEIDARFTETVRAAGLGNGPDREAYIRILVTRGVGELTYDLAACPQPSVVVIVKKHVDPPDHVFDKGVKVCLVGIVRNHPATVSPRIKSNNLLNNALAMQEALRRGAEEALMQNHDGDIVECSQSNFFIVTGQEVRTPPLAAGLLPGITRELVLELAASAGCTASEQRITPEDLRTASEAFITGTTREITPVVAIDELTIGSGKPGPVTTRLLAVFRERVGAPYVAVS